MKFNHGRQWMFGFILIGAGAIFLLQRMGYVDLDIGDIFRTFWPVILVYIGLSGLFQGGFWGIFPLGVGAYYLLYNLNIITLSWGEFMSFAVPLGLITGGLFVLFKPRRKKSHSEHKSQGEGEIWWGDKEKDDFSSKPSSFDSKGPSPMDYPDYGDPNYPDPFKNVDFSKDPFGKKQDLDSDGINKGQTKSGAGFDIPNGQGGGSFNSSKFGEKEGSHSWEYKFGSHSSDANYKGKTVNKSTFIGDFHFGQDYWELKPMNVSHFIGDTTIDLTRAQVPYGVTKINVSCFIGDVKVYLPYDVDLGVYVESNSFAGDIRVLEQKESGFMRSTNVESPNYNEAGKKVRLIISSFIGDVKVKRVG